LSIVDDIIPEGATPEETTEEAPAEAPLASPEADAPLANETSETVEVEATPAEEAWIAAMRSAGYGNYVDEAGGDPVKLAERLHGLRQQLSRGQQPEPTPEPEQQPELMVGDIVWPPESVPELYAAAQNPEFAGQAAIWAMENRHRIPQQAFQDVVNNWWFTNPAQAQAHQTQQLLREELARFEQQLRPVQEHTAKTVSDAAQSLAQQSIGADWDAYKGRISEICQDEQAASFFFRHGQTPEGLAQGIVDAYGWLKQQEWMASRRGQAPAPTAPEVPASPGQEDGDRPRDEHGRFAATTTGRGSAPSRNPTKDEEIRDAILGV
jgi:hypothetical protein